MAAKTPKQTSGPPEGLAFDEPHKKQGLHFAVLPTNQLKVISHQRKPSDTHVKKVTASIEKLGFLAPVVVVPQEDSDEPYLIVDGQHRFLAAQALGLKTLPAVIVPHEVARKMLGLNVEKEPNIRERSAVALSIYRELVEAEPKLPEDDGQVVDAVEQAHYVTLGIAYEQSGRLSGSSFEPILKKCDGFQDAPLADTLPLREERAAKVLEADKAVKEIADALKETGAWHQFIGQQIISYANPLKRTRKQASFDETFKKMLAKLEELKEKPEKVLGSGGD
ncbi:MAG TPA: ParB/RepB/Spo0J family partition protein [Actinomycetota bacterium]|nr:ParB/RepB/Spo0J family partition protein [Actinomycetota bacterium]